MFSESLSPSFTVTSRSLPVNALVLFIMRYPSDYICLISFFIIIIELIIELFNSPTDSLYISTLQ